MAGSDHGSNYSLEDPLFFASHGCPLYGLVCAARSARRSGAPALVACHGVGPEHMSTSRILVLAARRAATLGIPGVAYHSRGHGDSAGDFADVTLESLTEDALCAADCVRKMTGASHVIWLGIRFGAMVAAQAARRSPDSVGLALWEPIHRGQDYLLQLVRGLLFSAAARGQNLGVTAKEILDRVAREGRVDVNATYLHQKFYESARASDLSKILEGWSGPTLIAQIQARPKLSGENQALLGRLQQGGAEVRAVQIKEEPGWQFWRDPWVSTSLLDETGAWFNAVA